MPLVIITTCFTYRNCLLVISHDGWRIGQRLITIASLCLQDRLYQFLPWSGTAMFGAVIYILGQKSRQKVATSSFLGYLGEIELDSPTVWTCISCATVSASNFQVLICSDWRDSTWTSFIRYLAGPTRTILDYITGDFGNSATCSILTVCLWSSLLPFPRAPLLLPPVSRFLNMQYEQLTTSVIPDAAVYGGWVRLERCVLRWLVVLCWTWT